MFKWSNGRVKKRRGFERFNIYREAQAPTSLSRWSCHMYVVKKVRWDVTSVHCSRPITQCHVGRRGWSLSLFVETSYSLRLGGACVQVRPWSSAWEKDIGHRWTDSNGGPRKLGPTSSMSWHEVNTQIPGKDLSHERIMHGVCMVHSGTAQASVPWRHWGPLGLGFPREDCMHDTWILRAPI